MNDDFERIKELMKDSMSSIFNVTSDSFTEFKQIMDNDKIFSFDYFFEDGRPVSTGLKSHKPSVRKYNECLDKKGLSVWDSKGYWRCLFPQAIIPKDVNGVLTKEVFEDSIRDKSYDGKYDLGEKGIYFKNFEDLMNWKASMFKVAKEQRPQIVWDEKFNQWNDRCKKWTNKMNEKLEQVSLEKDKRVEKYVDKYTDKYGDNNVGNVKTDVVPIPEGKTVVSTDIQTIWINDDKESSYKETRTEYYSDGTSKTNTISRTSPPEKKGWFWN